LRGVDPKRLIFVDESSTNIALTPRYGRAPRGERSHGRAPKNWGKNVTLISSISLQGMGPSMSIEGSSDTESFGLYMRQILAPSLKPAQIVLMDNLSVHKSRWVRELIEERGCQLWLLPSYSPDMNPIEEAFSKAKNLTSGRRRRGRSKRYLRSPLTRSKRSASRTHVASSRPQVTRRLGATHYENRSRCSSERLRACADRLATFRIWLIDMRLNSRFTSV
jgi:transposase